MLACFNTCVGLIACVGEYFHALLPCIPYPALAAFFAAASNRKRVEALQAVIRSQTVMSNTVCP